MPSCQQEFSLSWGYKSWPLAHKGDRLSLVYQEVGPLYLQLPSLTLLFLLNKLSFLKYFRSGNSSFNPCSDHDITEVLPRYRIPSGKVLSLRILKALTHCLLASGITAKSENSNSPSLVLSVFFYFTFSSFSFFSSSWSFSYLNFSGKHNFFSH